MTWTPFMAEYATIIRRARAEGWLGLLLEAHTTVCTREQAERILRSLDLPADLKLLWRSQRFRGRARYSRLRRQYGISLPTVQGTLSGYLRVGLVLHEAAHIWDHQQRKRFGHGPEFCKALRDAFTTDWRSLMPTSSYREIYDRHRGPYSLGLVRDVEGKRGKIEPSSDHLPGPFSAEDAHEEARLLVKDPKENITEVFVFSLTEGQFIGCFYKRGDAHRPWHEEEETLGRVDLRSEQEPAALVFRKTSLGTTLVGSTVGEDGMQPSRPGPRRAAPAKDRTSSVSRVPGSAKRGSALELDAGNAERRPKSAGAQLVFAFLGDGRRATPKEINDAIGAHLIELGIQFPIALISRLKQAGFLHEVHE